MERIKIFISYSSKDKYFAGDLKNCFEEFVGFDLFLAHDDLNPSDDWFQEILINLKKTDFVMPLISQNLMNSHFANQEIGFALGINKKIIPISVDGTDPYSLIHNTHAYKCKEWNWHTLVDAVNQIYLLFIYQSKFRSYQKRAMRSIVYALNRSPNFKTTSIILNTIIQINHFVRFDQNQLNDMISASQTNPNIFQADFLYPKLVNFLKENYGINV